jgi:Domain of unknown function (DUF3425)
MMPCEEQLNCHHLSLVDFFAWPTLRAFLITRSVIYLPEYSAALFAEHLNFRWQYDPEDVFITHQSTGRYFFSDTFRSSFEDLANWTLNKPFFSFAPGLTDKIPANKRRRAAIESDGHGDGATGENDLCGDMHVHPVN